jgi:hypothetical protein
LPVLIRDRGPSFQELAAKYLRGVSAGTAIRELRRQSLVQVLPDEVIRLRASASRSSGFNPSNIAEAAKRIQRLAATVLTSGVEGESKALYKEINNLKIDTARMPLVQRTLDRRAQVFLEGIERELKVASRSKGKASYTRLGISVISWEEERTKVER